MGLIGAGEGRGADEGFMALRRVSDQVKEERRRGWKRGARPAASRVRLPRSFIKHGSSVRGRLSADSAGFVSVPFQEKKSTKTATLLQKFTQGLRRGTLLRLCARTESASEIQTAGLG